MQPLELQFYSFFMVYLTGAGLGLLFDLLRVLRARFQPTPLIGAVADLSFWVAATAAVSAGLFHGNWGDLRFYVLVSLLLGVGSYYWLASPVILSLFNLLLDVLTWLTRTLVRLVLKLVWAPLVAMAGLMWSWVLLLERWLRVLVRFLGGWASQLLDWLMRPLVGPYRFCRLHYLLAKRRLKRKLRRWLLGPPRKRR